MKKRFLLPFLMLLGFGVTGFAQSSTTTTSTSSSDFNDSYSSDANLLTLSYGIPNMPLRHEWDNKLGPFYARYEHGIFDYFGVGAYVGYGHGSFKGADYKDQATSYGFGAMAFYHFNRFIPVENLDVFLGAGIAFRGRHTNYSKNSAQIDRQSSYFRVSGVVKAGARYYFSPNIGVFGEVGYDGLSIADFGLTFRF